jgi:small subunit ribosomal protein S9
MNAKKGNVLKAKKKTAVARATVKKGKGNIKINRMGIDAYARGYVKDLILEPVMLAGADVKEYDIDVNVHGSGFMSQAMAVRAAIAKALVKIKGKKCKDLFLAYDRSMLVDDVRKVESKKPLGRKARKKKQHSKR